jgi:plasmid stabilization system protein ParE
MSAYVLAPLAKADIFDIWAYIAENSETAADRVEQAIYDACAFLAEGPSRGHTRPHPLFTGRRRRRFKSLLCCTESGTSGAFSGSASSQHPSDEDDTASAAASRAPS